MKRFIKLALSVILASSFFLPLGDHSGQAAQPNHVLISEVYYDTNLSYEPENMWQSLTPQAQL